MIGKTISHYRIIKELGRGGMGIVYEAQDIKLERTVALKFLPPKLTRDAEAKARFIREAKSAAAINHPNICTVYEIDDYEGASFIAMERIEGQSLKSLMEQGPLKIEMAVDIAAQIAHGLAGAHDKGICHRDIKPANIMVTEEGQVKIMDFGLAKLRDRTVITKDSSTLGTVSYMSPEQGHGDEVGPESDIWSLGVVLYEMVTGKLPFSGEYDVSVMYSIINEQPEPASRLRPEIPPELEKIIEDTMKKDSRERRSDSFHLYKDLAGLRLDMDMENRGSQNRTLSWNVRWSRLVPLIAVIVAVFAVMIFMTRIWPVKDAGGPLLPGAPFQVTSGDAWESEPAISPDGGRIAYTSDISGNRDIYVVDARGGNPIKLTANTAADYHPVWFPDGTSLAFTSERSGEASIWKIGQFGGGATLILKNASYPAVSPDGNYIAFSRAGKKGNLRIGVASLKSPLNQNILTDDEDGLWDHRYASWSPDGKLICYSAQQNLWIIPPSGGKARRLTSEGRMDSDPEWSCDGSRIYFSSYRDGPLALWRVSLDGSGLQRLTTGTGCENAPTLSRDGSRFVYAARKIRRNLIIRNMLSGEEAMLPGLSDDYMATLAPDGRAVVYASERVGSRSKLWWQDLENGAPVGAPRRLTDDRGDASHPAFSPDGKWIAYYRIVGEQRDIWIIPAAGGMPIQFTHHEASDIQPAWSPDGSMIAFNSEREEGPKIWVAPVSEGVRTGDPWLVTEEKFGAAAPAWSFDGSMIAFVGLEENLSDIWIAPADGSGKTRRVTSGANARRVKWEPETGDILVSGRWGEDLFTLRRVSLSDGSLSVSDPELVFGSIMAAALFDLSLDGKSMVYSKEDIKANIWMLETEKGVY